jgi:hypothetical protein
LFFCILSQAGCNASGSKIISLCENELRDRLISPSSYERVTAELTAQAISIPEYKHILTLETAGDWTIATKSKLKLKFDILDSQTNEINAGRHPSPYRFQVVFKYEPENAIGTILQRNALCEYVSADDTEIRASEFNVKVNGLNRTEYLIELLKSGAVQ